MQVKIGDKVALKSGGPDMLIVDLHWGQVVCAWRTRNGVSESPFRKTSLLNKS